jgi:tetratricopeptide (TPR) repeat protein
LLEAKQFPEAAEQARRVVELTRASPGTASEDLQVALMNLATAQYLAADYVGAEESYLRVIELVEASGRLTNPRLARAQAGLAATYYAGKRYDLAVDWFDRAVALSRRTEGLFNEEQLPLLEKYADALAQVNRPDDALRVRAYALRVVARKHGSDSLEYAAALESIGRWYSKVGAYDASRAALRRSIEIVEAREGENSLELVGPLTGLGECARRMLLDPAQPLQKSADSDRRTMFHEPIAQPAATVSASTIASEGQKALERAAAIVSSRPETTATQVADVHVQLGDWYQARQRPDKALPSYERAWQAAGGVTVGAKSLREALFAQPVLLYYSPPPYWNRYARRPAGEVEVRNAEVEFTVTVEGQAVAPTLVSDAGDPEFGEKLVAAADSAVYRPRFEEGKPVATLGVRLSQPFYVLLVEESADGAPKAGN